ncbi:HD domain-containing protein [Desulfovibrio ferrophilus]|uniref:Metal-dependent phosphohydrolase n=1 Tax=Desulfovibrio ferrophilus TaxID=241368 RepID=A0A2Z6AZA1_9BACT|nr:HD domain-containing protein [Desulfovibrio ferrophilus]BBD08572.1 metal-dependent phosphohydrolase [Desulfovibrio ferrophilus]
MPIIRKSLLQFIFSGAYMQRWNDKLRPVALLEVDKQAHKMMVAWLLLMLNSRGMTSEQRRELGESVVEGGIFDYFYRLVITDIKPPIYYRIKENPAHYALLTSWVLDQLRPTMQPLGQDYWDKLTTRLKNPGTHGLADEILDAAHTYASGWEFDLIKDLGPWDDEKESIDQSFTDGLKRYDHLVGVKELRQGPSTALGRFAHLCGQLRFQTRWSQTPRIPETSVLGHLFIVAAYSYFFSLAVDACPLRRQNNFFTGLFHDLPEVLTRDIISPVKKSAQPIADLIRQYEDSELETRVFGPLTAGGYGDVAERLSYFLGVEVGSEFKSAIIRGGRPQAVDFETLQQRCNEDRYDPKDGRMLKACDSLAAFVEAYTALRNGISSDQLQQAVWRIRKRYNAFSFGDLHVGALLADFD